MPEDSLVQITNNYPPLLQSPDSITNHVPVWDDILFSSTMHIDSTRILIPEGMESIWRTTSFFHSDSVIALLLSIFILLCITIAFFRKAKTHYFTSIFKHKNETEQINLTVLEQWKQVLYSLFGLIGYTSIALYLVVEKSTITNYYETWEIGGWLFVALFLYFFIKYILLKLYVYTFFSTTNSLAIRQYFSIIFYSGQLTFLFLLGILFSNEYVHIYLYYGVAILALLTLLSMFYIIYRTFFSKIHLVLYFILYLCTLEILPLCLLIKVLVGDIYFINH
ncbi:MAG: DUF4271 domain-containing protein [Bacteroidales bacterium]|nr:DUF4271 domain-containing protein [Bacteroidales bacterium]